MRQRQREQHGHPEERLEEEITREMRRRVLLGVSAAWGDGVPLSLSTADRLRHLHVIGQTGTGKSTLLLNLALQDVEAGAGVGVIDPHGDLVDELLERVPPRRAGDVVLFDPSDLGHPPAFNLLAGVPPDLRHLAVSGVVGSLKAIWRDSWGPRLEHLLGNAVAALMEAEGQSLLGVSRLFADAAYRRRVVGRVRDPVVLAFFERELAGYDKRFLAEAAAPIQNKLGQLLLSPPVRNVLGQSRRKIDLRRVMDDGQIFLAKLPRGRLGPDKAALLGSLLVGQFELAALSRADMHEGRRRPFHLVVDEFATFATDGFASMLSEVRKYGLSLALAQQYLAQARREVREAAFGNAGSLCSFRVGGDDAQEVARQLAGDVRPGVIGDLDPGHAVMRLMGDNRLGRTMVARTPPPGAFGRRWGRGGLLREQSRARFCTPRHAVEEKIGRWLT